ADMTDGAQALQKQVFTRIASGQAYHMTPVEKAWFRRCAATNTYQLKLFAACGQKSEELLHILLQPPATPAQSCMIDMEDTTLAILLRPLKPKGIRVISTAGILRPDAPLVLCTVQHSNFDLLYERVCMMRHQLKVLQFMTPEF